MKQTIITILSLGAALLVGCTNEDGKKTSSPIIFTSYQVVYEGHGSASNVLSSMSEVEHYFEIQKRSGLFGKYKVYTTLYTEAGETVIRAEERKVEPGRVIFLISVEGDGPEGSKDIKVAHQSDYSEDFTPLFEHVDWLQYNQAQLLIVDRNGERYTIEFDPKTIKKVK